MTMQPPRRASRQAAVLVVGVGVSCALHIGKLPVAIPLLRDALQVSLLQAGFLLSLVQLAGMLLGVFVGLGADRWGPRRVMLAGLCLLAAGSTWGAWSSTIGELLASRALEGFGFLLAVLPAPGLLRRQVDDSRVLSRALGWWGAYMPLGTALALLLGAPLMQAWGWRAVWLWLGITALIAALVLWRVVPHDASPLAPVPLVGRLRRTLSARDPWLVAAAFLLYSGQWLAVIGFLPTVVAQAGYSGSVIGGLSALAALVNMVGNIGAGRWLAAGARPGWVLAGAFLTMGLAALIAFGMPGHPWVQYLAVIVFSAVGGLIPGTLFVLAVRLAPGQDTVSTTVGWMQQLSSLGQFAGPPLVAWVATQAGGWQLTGVVTALASALGLLVAAALHRRT